tara:strand:- start:999 stop:1307 length:309 start_codon:yes stop_codon:yes gene_type:complete
MDGDSKFIAIVLIGIVIVVTILMIGTVFLGQGLEKRTFGDFKYKVKVDRTWYVTNEYHIDENGCIHFIDNYKQKWMWCEKYSVGNYYFHNNNPTFKTVIFGI